MAALSPADDHAPSRRRADRVRRPIRRAGISLLEAIIALGILVGSTAMLAQLLGIARAHIDRAERLRMAQRLCQNTMNEIAAGLLDAEPIQEQAYVRPAGWSYSVAIEPLGGNMVAVRVAVYAPAGDRATRGAVGGESETGSPMVAEPSSLTTERSAAATAATASSGGSVSGSSAALADSATFALSQWMRVSASRPAPAGGSTP